MPSVSKAASMHLCDGVISRGSGGRGEGPIAEQTSRELRDSTVSSGRSRSGGGVSGPVGRELQRDVSEVGPKKELFSG